MLRALYYKADTDQLTEVAPQDYAAALLDKSGILWVDFGGEDPEPSESILLNTFEFHPLAVDDALHETHVPKVDDWEKYLYIAMHAISFTGEEDIKPLSLTSSMENYIVTYGFIPHSTCLMTV
jgi:magnesium transporter